MNLTTSQQAGLKNESAVDLFGPSSSELLKNNKDLWMRNVFDENKESKIWTGKGWPHKDISIRGGKIDDQIEAIWEENKEVLEKLSHEQALLRLFPG
jgi:hypothetical protein